MRTFRSGDDGFTLIEVLVAALVLVLAFTALATVFLSGESEASGQVQETQLISVADQQIEQIRADVSSVGFDALALSAVPTVPASPVTVSSTWANPTSFVETGTAPCGFASSGSSYAFEIASNYDNVTTSGSAPYGTSPSSFVPWSGCSQSEPLEVIPSASGTALVTVGGTEPTCSASVGTTSPCKVTEGGNTFDVYTFVTDTYVGCVTGTTATAATVVCPSGTSTSTIVSASNPVNTTTCATPTGTATGTFATSTTTSTPCADARRVTIAVVPSNEQSLTAKAKNLRITPFYLSSIFTNPTPAGSSASGTVGLTLGSGI